MAHTSLPASRKRSRTTGAGTPAQKRKPTVSRPAWWRTPRRLLPRITVLAVTLVLLVGIIALVRGNLASANIRSDTAATIGTSTTRHAPGAPDFTLPLLSGTTFHLAGELGHPVVLYFMATTCATCVQGSQQFAQAMQTANVAGAKALAIDVNPGDRPTDLYAFVQSVGQKASTTLQWGIDGNDAIATAYGVQTLETMVVINAQGQIVARSASPIPPDQLARLLKSAA
jgi:peroxiredoxin